MNDKYTLEEIKQMLLEPSFDGGEYEVNDIDEIIELIEDAIKHHEKLNKSNNGEGF